MKGIILAGGSGSRLYPLTQITSKQLLPVYDKPMIHYPLSTLMLFGIREILVISTPQDTPNIEKLLGDGSQIGIKLQYAIQEEPRGIAQAFTIGADFIGDDDVCLILGDNIFYMADQCYSFRKQMEDLDGALIFAYHVNDPERFGVIEFDKNYTALSIEEKPKVPKSNYAAVGLYVYNNDVVQFARNLQPSARGEFEITDINKIYLEQNRLKACVFARGTAWLDAGTPDSLLEAGQYVQILEKRQGLKISCIEEIALRWGYIDSTQLRVIIEGLNDCDYKGYLQKICKEYDELHSDSH